MGKLLQKGLSWGTAMSIAALAALSVGALAEHYKPSEEQLIMQSAQERSIYITSGPSQAGKKGSGTLLDDGYILTNAHVLHDDPRVLPRGYTLDGKMYRLRVEYRDVEADIALLRIIEVGDRPDMPPLVLRSSQRVDPIWAVGYPRSMFTMTRGLLQGQYKAQEEGIEDWLLSDAQLAPGSSGGTLYSLEHCSVATYWIRGCTPYMVGIPTAVQMHGRQQLSYMGYSIPAEKIYTFLRENDKEYLLEYKG